MLYRLENVTKKYGAVKALDMVSFDINEGDFLCITGHSGSGKSTLLKLLSGMIKPENGTILFRDLMISECNSLMLLRFRRDNIGYITQNYSLLEEDTVYDNIALPLRIRHFERNEIDKRVKSIAKRIGLSDKIDNVVQKLSGGQRQRCAIARALVGKPSVLLCDEPTGALDHDNEDIIMEILHNISSNGTTIVMVTHDLVLANHAERQICLENGQIIDSSLLPRKKGNGET